jgi:hypothetical protein
MGRYMCSVCDQKELARVIGEESRKGLSNVAISRLMTLRGTPVSRHLVTQHLKHAPEADPSVTAAANKRDLAILVRDMTWDAVKRGDLSITDAMWRNVTPGLKAEQIIDARAARTDERKTMIAIAMLLSGAAGSGPPEHLLVGDGLEIEGEAVEVEAVDG